MSTQIETQTHMPKTNDKPVQEVRFGSVKAAVWKNRNTNGVRYNTTFSRIYKDKEDNQWKSTDSFGHLDLLLLAKVADHTHTWIAQQTQEKGDETQD